jgi:hypothetical protein
MGTLALRLVLVYSNCLVLLPWSGASLSRLCSPTMEKRQERPDRSKPLVEGVSITRPAWSDRHSEITLSG